MAALPTQGLTAYLMLTACTQLRPGESVLVQGASGGVGSIAVQIARILGAGLVLGTAGSEKKRQFVRSIGADFAVDYNRPDWPKDVLGKTGGRGVDILLESIGREIFEQNFECLATFGRYIIFGSTRGPGKPFEPRRLMKKSQSISGIYLPVYLAKPDLLQEALQFFVEQVANGKLRPQVSQTLPLSQAAEAHRLLEEQKTVGVIVLNPKR
jgi:NADPH:quinone reductase